MLKNRLLQLFKDNADIGPKMLKTERTDTEATMYLYDAIGDWYGLNASEFIKELAGVDAETIHLRINSPGGDVFDARAIATAIKQKGNVIAHIDGVCASAATYIATSCNEVEMAEGSFFMIHKAWTLAMGNADDMRSTADLLEKVDGSIVNDFCKKTGKDAEEISQMMAAETWMTASEALENGFVDRIFDGEDVENKWNLSAYDNVPDSVLSGTKNAIANDVPLWYDREKYEKRLNLIEALK
jgi:ATP-dependent Clp protease, protease subunit